MTAFRIIAVLLILLALVALPYSMATDFLYADNHSEYRDVAVSNAAVTVFTEVENENTIDLALESVTSNIVFRDHTDAVPSTDIVIIDESWIKNNDVSSEIEYLIIQGNPVIMYTSTPEEFIGFCTENRISYSFPATAQVFCLKIAEDGTICCYSVDGVGGSQQALTYAYNWAVEKINADGRIDDSTGVTTLDTFIGKPVQSFADFDCGGMGWMSIRTHYYPIAETNETYNYVHSYFKLRSQPAVNHATADMVVYSDVDLATQNQMLVDYGPTSGVFTATASPGIGINQDRVLGTFSVSRLYVSDVIVHDSSEFNNDLMDIWYDVDETTTAGQSTLQVESENIVRIVDTGANDCYSAIDEYRITYVNHHVSFGIHFYDGWIESCNTMFSTVYL